MKAQSPEEIFKLLNDAKTEEEYVLILVGGSQGHIPVEVAREFWKSRNVKAANDALTEYIINMPYSAIRAGFIPMPGVPKASDWLSDYDATFGKYYMHK